MNLYQHKHIFARIAFAVTILIITCLAVIPGSTSLPQSGNDKLNHIMAFFVLAALLDHAFPHHVFSLNKVLPLAGYGMIIEIIQFCIPSRTFSFYDLFADIIGIYAYIVARKTMRYTLNILIRNSQTEEVIN